MGTALTGLEIRDTYDALIKITDNGPIGATAKLLSDGLGNDSVLTLSTTSVGVGGDTSGTVSGVTINAKFCVKSEGTVSGAGFVYANDTTAANGSVIYACRSRGTIASPTAVVSGDRLASLIFAGNDGTDLALAAQINIEADGTVGANDMPGRITFLTTPDGTQAPTEKMRIANDGKLKFNSYGSGTITGTAAYNLGVDASGNVIELPGGVIDGAGTANYVPKWTDANTLGDSQLFDNGTSVGIGTATPGQKLVVSGGTNGRVRINVTEGTGNFGKFEFSTSDSLTTSAVMLSEITAAITDSDPNTLKADLSFSTNSGDSLAEVMRITSTGRVGIGTTTPALLLDIVGTNSVGVKVTETGGSEARLVAGGSTTFFGTYSDHPLAILTNSIERVRITSAGNVGIGLSAPQGNLDVKGSTNVAFYLRNSSNGDTGTDGLLLGNVGGVPAAYQIWNYENGYLRFGTNGTERIRIDATGNVGIGTSAPAALLTLQDGNVDNVSGSKLRMVMGPNPHWEIQANNGGVAADRKLVFNTSASAGNVLTLTQEGNVGIGTSTASRLLTLKNNTGATNGISFQSLATTAEIAAIECNQTLDTIDIEMLSNFAGNGVRFLTGTPTLVERARFTANGLTFNGDTAAANALDDYEEGTFSPTLAFGGASTGITYFDRVGVYTKIGRQVTCTIYLALTNVGSATGNATLEGLPFANGNVNRGSQSAGSIRFDNITYGGSIMITVPNSSTNILFAQVSEAGADTNLTNANFNSGSEMSITITYFV